MNFLKYYYNEEFNEEGEVILPFKKLLGDLFDNYVDLIEEAELN